MRVKFDRAVLDQPALFGRDIYVIVDRCDQGRHTWVIDDLDDVLASTWIRDRPSWDPLDTLAEKTWRAAIDETSAGPQQRLLSVMAECLPTAALSGVLCATPARAREILDEPLYLILENATSDWSFIRAITRTFARTELEIAISKNWIVPDQAGGSGEFEKRASALIARKIEPTRIAILMDSDRLVPGPLPSDVAKRIARLQSIGTIVLALFKREVENYMPESVLDSKATNAVRVSFLSLRQEQRDHFDMKFGFERDPRTGDAVIHESQQALFAGTNPWHMKRLVGGFGRKIGDRFGETTVDRAEIVEVCKTCPGELEQLLQTLEELL